MIPGHETGSSLQGILRTSDQISLSKHSYYCPIFREVAPFPPIDSVVLPQKFPTTLKTGPSSKLVPGPLFSPVFPFPSRNWPFCRSPRAFFQDQAFSLLPARPCCPGQQESTTTLTNRFRRQAKPGAEQSLNI